MDDKLYEHYTCRVDHVHHLLKVICLSIYSFSKYLWLLSTWHCCSPEGTVVKKGNKMPVTVNFIHYKSI